jgi:hypothetical protein
MAKRIYRPFWQWEDLGMWCYVSAKERKHFLPIAIDFTGDAERYGAAMLRVVQEMPYACEHNLTERAMNRRAWVGHAAAFLATGCPESVTREAWGMLTEEQRVKADAKADEAIKEWEIAQANRKVPEQLEIKGL